MKIEMYEMGGPDSIARVGAFIDNALASMPPEIGQAGLGAALTNIVGNIPEEHWEKMKAAAKLPCECGDPNCRVATEALMEAAELARQQFNRVLDGRTPPNPDEKGFSA